jgi:RIO-like serine/threonine protein kinase
MSRAPLTRDEFLARAGENLSPERWYKPEVRPVTIRGVPCLVKDFGRRPRLWRATAGRFVIGREATIYRVLAGLPGIPRFFGQFDEDSLIVERIDGTDLSSIRKRDVEPGFVDRVARLVDRIHARGVVHWDLRQRKNILVGRDGRPWLIDFASGVRLPPDSILLSLARISDLSGVAKLREKYAPDTLTASDRKLIKLDRLRPFRRARKERRHRRKAERKARRERRRAERSVSPPR